MCVIRQENTWVGELTENIVEFTTFQLQSTSQLCNNVRLNIIVLYMLHEKDETLSSIVKQFYNVLYFFTIILYRFIYLDFYKFVFLFLVFKFPDIKGVFK